MSMIPTPAPLNDNIYISHTEEMVLNSLCSTVNLWAESKGWNEVPDSRMHKAEQIALMHTELSECLEFIRTKTVVACTVCGQSSVKGATRGTQQSWICTGNVAHTFDGPSDYPPAMDDHVPVLEGEAAELADVLIRIFHYCGKRGIDLGRAVRLKHEYNITRPYKHGKLS